MPTVRATVSCPVRESFRVQQVAGMFGFELTKRAKEHFEVDVPSTRENWQIGLIVGPSGSGKSTVAARAFGDRVYAGAAWPGREAVIDCFAELPIRQIVELFTAVGFSSPPAWIKPYGVLSNGERFRCDLARALAAGLGKDPEPSRKDSKVTCYKPPVTEAEKLAVFGSSLVVFDEFTSVVDRTVAKVCSAAIAKAIRRGSLPCQFVAVTCHYDVANWLAPDWILDMSTCDLQRRRLRRPPIELEIRSCKLAAWQLFKRHHYLSGELPRGARCFMTTWEGAPVNFCATAPLVARKNHRRFARIVTLPDYQGIGIGMRAMAAVADLHRAEGLRVNVTSSHPALVRHCERSPLWQLVGIRRADRPRRSTLFSTYRSTGRTVVSFEYRGRGKGELGRQKTCKEHD
jgi:GNAT superfamily N-acetyltransferase